MYAEDTIAAIATPPGPGGIGIVRASGPAAQRIAASVFERRHPGPWTSHRLYGGNLLSATGTTIDRGLAVVMKRPHSFTGEDVLELHGHGSPNILQLLLDAVLQAGARPAGRGEFTRRAFLNGRLDLIQAESVLDLIHSRTHAAAVDAAAQMAGKLSTRLDDIRTQILHAKALFEVQLDFAEETPDTTMAASAILATVQDDMNRLLATYTRGQLQHHGLRVALVGRPNAGKSTLLNTLLGRERAIVTPEPGTTRDVVEGTIDLGGIPVMLTDTAGLRDGGDPVERIGVQRAREVAARADVVLALVDRSLPPIELPTFDAEHTIVVLNKTDLPTAWHNEDVAELARRHPVVEISAARGDNLCALRTALSNLAGSQPAEDLPILTRERHRAGVAATERAVSGALQAIKNELPPEIIAVELQEAVDCIGTLAGVGTTEDVLDLIFSEFCIGK